MSKQNHLRLTLLIVLSSAVVSAFAALRLIAPTTGGAFSPLGPGLAERILPAAVCAAIALAAGLTGIAVGILGYATRTSAPSPVLRAAAFIVAGVLLLLAPG